MKEILHIGIPTNKSIAGERYLDNLKLYVTDPGKSPYQIEYVRFTPETLLPPAVQFAPHIAFSTDHMKEELEAFDEVLFGPVDMGEMVIAFAKKDEIIFEISQNSGLESN